MCKKDVEGGGVPSLTLGSPFVSLLPSPRLLLALFRAGGVLCACRCPGGSSRAFAASVPCLGVPVCGSFLSSPRLSLSAPAVASPFAAADAAAAALSSALAAVRPAPAPAVAPVCLSAGSGPVSWGGLVGRVVGFPAGVGGRRGWCASSGRVLVSVLPVGESAPVLVRCSVAPWGRPAAPGEVSALVASLRAASASGAVLSFALRGSFSARAWFCGVRPA